MTKEEKTVRRKRYYEASKKREAAYYQHHKDKIALKEKERRQLQKVKERRRIWQRNYRRTLKGREVAAKDRFRKRAASAEPWLFRQIIDRTEGRCAVCGRLVLPSETINWDHMIPIVRGGNSVPNNIVLTHDDCNRRKSDKIIKLAIQPKPAKPAQFYLNQPTSALAL